MHIDPNNIMTILVALTNRRNKKRPLRKPGWTPAGWEEENAMETPETPESTPAATP